MNTHLSFHWEFRQYEVRTVHQDFKDRSSPIRKDCPIELVKWNDESKSSCYVIAYFYKDDEGYELHSVGGRLFEEISVSEIAEVWKQLQAAQKMLDSYAEADEDF